MDPTQPAALNAKLYLRHSQSFDVLTEEGRQINNGYLNKNAAYLEDGAPRMGFSREPADFAFVSFVKTKIGDINSTEGKNVLQAMATGSADSNPAPAASGSNGSAAPQVAANNNIAAETSKGSSLNLNA